MPAPEPDDETQTPHEDPQVDEPTDPGTEASGGVGSPAAKLVVQAPPGPTGVPVSYGPPAPADAPLSSGGAAEDDMVPADIMPELDHPIVKHRHSGGLTFFKGPYEIVNGLQWVLRTPRSDGLLGRLPGVSKELWSMISEAARKKGWADHLRDYGPPSREYACISLEEKDVR